MAADIPVAAIIGTGLIGRGWAMVFARAGWTVRLWDAAPAAAAAAQVWLEREAEAAATLGQAIDPAAIRRATHVADSLEAALEGAAWAQESGPERLEIKRQILAGLDAAAPAACVLASSTSTFPGSSFLADLSGRARAIVAHPANPPHLLPAVEVVPSPWHTPAFVAEVSDTLRAVGQWPVQVEKEPFGFVMNRLQAAIVNEAVALVADGAVAAAGIDTIIRGSLGRRWAFLGPFGSMDLNAPGGFMDYATRYADSYRQLGETLEVATPWPSAALEQIARALARPGQTTAERQAWRDMILLQMRALVDQEPPAPSCPSLSPETPSAP